MMNSKNEIRDIKQLISEQNELLSKINLIQNRKTVKAFIKNHELLKTTVSERFEDVKIPKIRFVFLYEFWKISIIALFCIVILSFAVNRVYYLESLGMNTNKSLSSTQLIIRKFFTISFNVIVILGTLLFIYIFIRKKHVRIDQKSLEKYSKPKPIKAKYYLFLQQLNKLIY